MAAFNGYMTEANSLVINIDTHLKSFYSSLNHASLFYSKYFQDSFVVFLAKIILGNQPLKLASEHLYLQDHKPIWLNNTINAPDFLGCQSDYSGIVLDADTGSEL